MPEGSFKFHKIPCRSDQALGRINMKRATRFWFNRDGVLTGQWLSRGGKTYAVGHRFGETIVYLAAQCDTWTEYDFEKSKPPTY